MTPDPRTYMGHAIAGNDPGDINDWVERWHDMPDNGTSLRDFLGFTAEEMEAWLLAPAALPHIIAVRTLVEEGRTALTHATAVGNDRLN